MSAGSQRRSAGSARSASSAPPRRPSLKVQTIDDLNGPQYTHTVLEWIRWSSLKLEEQERELSSMRKELGREKPLPEDGAPAEPMAASRNDRVLFLEAENAVLKKELIHSRAVVQRELDAKTVRIAALEGALRKLSVVMDIGKRIATGDKADVFDFAELGLGAFDKPEAGEGAADDWLDAEIAAVAAAAKAENSKAEDNSHKEDTIEEDDVGALDEGGAVDEDAVADPEPLPED